MKKKIGQKIKRNDPQIRLISWFVIAFSLFLIISTMAVKLISEVRKQREWGFDHGLSQALGNFSEPLLNATVPVATGLGSVIGVFVLMVLACSLFLYRRDLHRTLTVLLSVVGAIVIHAVFRAIFERDQPGVFELIVAENGFSFPSGHALLAAAFASSVVIAFRDSRWRRWGVTAAVAYVLYVGFTRLYLDANYLSDLVVGWAIGVVWAVVVWRLLESSFGRKAVPRVLKARKK